jgi:hypothetical protein
LSTPSPTSPQQQSVEYQKWIEELKRRDAERTHDQENELFAAANKAAIDTGQITLRTSILVNGGAAIAVLAFIGHLVAEEKIKNEQINELTSSLIWFVAGVACALAAFGWAYFVNLGIATLSNTRQRKWDHPYILAGPTTKKWNCIVWALRTLAVLFGVLSILLFVYGMYDVKCSVEHVFGKMDRFCSYRLF